MIISRTPMRISLIGGGSDTPAFYEKYPGLCISFSINKYVYIFLNEKFDGKYRVSYSQTENVDSIDQIKHNLVRTALNQWKSGSGGTGWDKFANGLEIVSIADIPGEGSGLGSSSSFTVGLLQAFEQLQNKEPMGKEYLYKYAFGVERQVNPNIGIQDHMAATMGGFNRLSFNGVNFYSEEVKSKWDCENPWSWNELHGTMLLLWTGISRKSDDILKAQKEGFQAGKNIEIGKDMVEFAKAFYENLTAGRINIAAQYVTDGWMLKKRLAPGISSIEIDYWINEGLKNGAWGGKLLGAGGGGFIFFMAPPDSHERIVKATGLRKVDFNIDYEGSVIIKREGWYEF